MTGALIVIAAFGLSNAQAPNTVKDVSKEHKQAAVFKGRNPVETDITAPTPPQPEPEEDSSNLERTGKNPSSGSRRGTAKRRRTKKNKSAPTATPSPMATGKRMAARRGWTGGQWRALAELWHRESNWNPRARNPSSGAYGIPQSLPGRKMRTAGSDWRTNPQTQIEWGISYIKERYGTPAAALRHHDKNNWY